MIVDVCFSPALLPEYSSEGSILVVIDVIRASTSFCVAFENGIKELIPLATIEETLMYKDKGYLTAGERNSEKLPGFDFGNSPFEFMNKNLSGEKLAITTTNGTKTIHTIPPLSNIVMGGFANYSVLMDYIQKQKSNILLVCSGWHNKPSIEDLLFAGKVVSGLKSADSIYEYTDAALISRQLYEVAAPDLFDFVLRYSPRLNKKKEVLGEDIRYCLRTDTCSVVPVLKEGKFVQDC